jgi:hypothetical protein
MISFIFNSILLHQKEQSYSTFRKNTFSRRCSSLKQSHTPNISLELQIQPSSTKKTINEVTSSSPKKPKWEVIEHFKSTTKGQDSISSSLIAVSLVFYVYSSYFVTCIHIVKVMQGFTCSGNFCGILCNHAY